MSRGVVTDHLVRLVAKQVEDHRLVVWYDPEGHYRAVAAALDLPETTVDRHDGSFFALWRRVSPLLEGLDPPRLVVYVPEERARTHNALIQLEAPASCSSRASSRPAATPGWPWWRGPRCGRR